MVVDQVTHPKIRQDLDARKLVPDRPHHLDATTPCCGCVLRKRMFRGVPLGRVLELGVRFLVRLGIKDQSAEVTASGQPSRGLEVIDDVPPNVVVQPIGVARVGVDHKVAGRGIGRIDPVQGCFSLRERRGVPPATGERFGQRIRRLHRRPDPNTGPIQRPFESKLRIPRELPHRRHVPPGRDHAGFRRTFGPNGRSDDHPSAQCRGRPRSPRRCDVICRPNLSPHHHSLLARLFASRPAASYLADPSSDLITGAMYSRVQRPTLDTLRSRYEDPDFFRFEDSPGLCRRLTDLVRSGQKTATLL